jgi:cytolysin-activating lysine-acyltransferase
LDANLQPRGFVSWANLSASGLTQVLSDQVDLQDQDWDAGPYPMVNDIIAPWGEAKLIIHNLRTEVFPTQRVLGIRRNQDGTIRKYFFFRGIAASEKPIAPNSATYN